MNEFVGLSGAPERTRYSLILIGLAFRTFSTAVSSCLLPLAAFVQDAFATRSPLNDFSPEVTLKVALTVSPGPIGSAMVFAVSEVWESTAVHSSAGTDMLNVAPVTGAPVVFVNDMVVACEDRGVNVCSPGGVVRVA